MHLEFLSPPDNARLLAMKPRCSYLALTLIWALGFGVLGVEPPKAARSVHLGFPASDGAAFALDMVVEKSTPGSYFMACGWNTGYFGIQELSKDRRVAIFSVWDPTQGDDPSAVNAEERVELLHHDPSARIKRFGGEGTGGQCMADFNWKLNETNRFLVAATIQSNKTAYAGFLFAPSRNSWRHLVTFRTRTGGLPLRGYYSFVEDFRRDSRSALETRRARFGNVWVCNTNGTWSAQTNARFTASGAEWEAKDTINAGITEEWFFLETGGAIVQTQSLRSTLSLPKSPRNPKSIPLELDALIRGATKL